MKDSLLMIGKMMERLSYNNSILKMKKIFYRVLFSILIVAICVSCSNSFIDEESVQSGQPFSIVASSSVDTKVVSSGYSKIWEAGDAVHVFHAVAGTSEYIDDGKFTINDISSNIFTGTLGASLSSDQSYDWYVFYPYHAGMDAPGGSFSKIGTTNTVVTETQNGNNSLAHLCDSEYYPLYGFTAGVISADVPSIRLNNIASVVEFDVANNLSTDISISSILFSVSQGIIGGYNIDYQHGSLTFGNSTTRNVTELFVQNGKAIKPGENAKFYIGIAPVSISSGEKISIRVYATNDKESGFQAFDFTPTESIAFNSGKYKTFELGYTTPIGTPLQVNSADIETLNYGVYKTSYATYQTYDRWILTNGCVLRSNNWNAITSLAPCLNGKKSSPGVFSSPLLAGGCGTLSFNYGLPYAKEKLSIRVDVKNASKEVVKTYTLTPDSPAQKTLYSFSEDVNVSGPFYLEFSNLSPSSLTSNKDRTAIFDIKWTNYSE